MENSLVASTDAVLAANKESFDPPYKVDDNDKTLGDNIFTVGASFILCPECKEGQVIPEGRCKHCLLCGWSACSI